MAAAPHHERRHSKFSASGAERWFNCFGSVALSEGLPDVENKYSVEGTQAHEVLEQVLLAAIEETDVPAQLKNAVPAEMWVHACKAAAHILKLHEKTPGSEIMVETRIHLGFIHPEMFGTFDGAVVDHFGTLHVFDYKYGKYAVSPVENLQMIFYGMGLAAKYHWNFKRARLWIVQPRSLNYDGPTFWEIGILELKKYVSLFQKAVRNVERHPDKFVEGSWCHFCKAKAICPLKREQKLDKAMSAFSAFVR